MATKVRAVYPQHRVAASVLPVEWEKTPQDLDSLYAREQPDVILHFGVSGLARGFVIEQVAQNTCSSSIDACGASPRGRYVTSKADPATLPTLLPASKIFRALKDLEIPVALSDDAGTYLCNAVFYRAVCLTDDTKPTRISGFIHMPPLYSRVFSHERALQGGLEIVRICLQCQH